MRDDHFDRLPSVPIVTNPIQARVLGGFDDPACAANVWNALLQQSCTDAICLTREWLQAWWETLGHGKLLLVAAECAGQVLAIAPWYAHEGFLFSLGAGESDYLDVIGDISRPEVLRILLETGIAQVHDFQGAHFYNLPADSATASQLTQVAVDIGLTCMQKDEWLAFDVDLFAHAEFVRTATTRSMLKREVYFRDRGPFDVQQGRSAEQAEPYFEEFFQQHIARWQAKGYPSPYAEPAQREFLRRVAQATTAAGWFRFLRLEWNGEPLALAFAWHYRGVHYCGPWSFAVEHGKHCPGHVLLRHRLLAALDEQLHSYDLRGGDDSYKSRLPTRSRTYQSWGLYPQ